MPGYTWSAPDLQQRGPVISIRVAPTESAQAAAAAAGQPMPAPVEVSALIDTGATMSAIDRETVRRLRLRILRSQLTATPAASPAWLPVYAVRFLVPGAEIETTAVEGVMRGHGAQAIIGRDVLAHGILVYVGNAGQCTIAF